MMAQLIKAAELAEELSISRRKQISLSLKKRGVQVTGELLDETGFVSHRYVDEIDWRHLDATDVSILETQIRAIDRRLVENWRADG